MPRPRAFYAVESRVPEAGMQTYWGDFVKGLEALVSDGWVIARIEPGVPPFVPPTVDFTPVIHANRDRLSELEATTG